MNQTDRPARVHCTELGVLRVIQDPVQHELRSGRRICPTCLVGYAGPLRVKVQMMFVHLCFRNVEISTVSYVVCRVVYGALCCREKVSMEVGENSASRSGRLTLYMIIDFGKHLR